MAGLNQHRQEQGEVAGNKPSKVLSERNGMKFGMHLVQYLQLLQAGLREEAELVRRTLLELLESVNPSRLSRRRRQSGAAVLGVMAIFAGMAVDVFGDGDSAASGANMEAGERQREIQKLFDEYGASLKSHNPDVEVQKKILKDLLKLITTEGTLSFDAEANPELAQRVREFYDRLLSSIISEFKITNNGKLPGEGDSEVNTRISALTQARANLGDGSIAPTKKGIHVVVEGRGFVGREKDKLEPREFSRELILEQFPDSQEGYLKVKKIL